ncbi:MAG: hypothetical protein DRJ65_00390 [Acidobacteria bacterium]|nr:MAG: hypothetical protein DRJ65_00390 [Acidobacteriota bacterium]
MRRLSIIMITLLAGWVLPASAQNVYWIPAAAHLSGFGSSVWRTDLALINLEARAATVELRLHRESGIAGETFVIDPGQQQIFQDAVALLTLEDASGSIEVRSTERLTVRSRTYNAAVDGSFGQALDGITSLTGIELNEGARLVQLSEDGSFRSNIGAVNMGETAATIKVDLYEASGAFIGSFDLDLPAGQLRQDGRPYKKRFQRTDIVGGFAEIQLTEGDHVYVYGSVIDNETGDPTTISMERMAACN